MQNDSMLGRWDGWYKGVKQQGSFRYGNTVSYEKAAKFLKGLDTQDWGCGTGGYKRVHEGKYTGLDGSKNPFVDKVVDLREYTTEVDGIVMRHLLEHNYDWERILTNAVASFKKRFCLIIFTPMDHQTIEIAHNKGHGVDAPTISFYDKDIERFFSGLKWKCEDIKTKTAYGTERIYYVER